MDHKRRKCFWTRLRCDDLRLYRSGPRHMSISFFFFFLTFSVYQRCNFHSSNILHSWINALLFLLNSLEVVRLHMSQWLAARRTAKVLQKGGGICGIRSCLCLFEETLTGSLYQSRHLRVTFALSCTIQVFKIREND